MPFNEAIAHESEYRKRRNSSLNNGERRRWYASDADDLLEVFNTDADNDTWQKAWEGRKADRDAVMRLRIAWLAGVRRDLRELDYAEDGRTQTSSDSDRYEAGRLSYLDGRMAMMKEVWT